MGILGGKPRGPFPQILRIRTNKRAFARGKTSQSSPHGPRPPTEPASTRPHGAPQRDRGGARAERRPGPLSRFNFGHPVHPTRGHFPSAEGTRCNSLPHPLGPTPPPQTGDALRGLEPATLRGVLPIESPARGPPRDNRRGPRTRAADHNVFSNPSHFPRAPVEASEGQSLRGPEVPPDSDELGQTLVVISCVPRQRLGNLVSLGRNRPNPAESRQNVTICRTPPQCGRFRPNLTETRRHPTQVGRNPPRFGRFHAEVSVQIRPASAQKNRPIPGQLLWKAGPMLANVGPKFGRSQPNSGAGSTTRGWFRANMCRLDTSIGLSSANFGPVSSLDPFNRIWVGRMARKEPAAPARQRDSGSPGGQRLCPPARRRSGASERRRNGARATRERRPQNVGAKGSKSVATPPTVAQDAAGIKQRLADMQPGQIWPTPDEFRAKFERSRPTSVEHRSRSANLGQCRGPKLAEFGLWLGRHRHPKLLGEAQGS